MAKKNSAMKKLVAAAAMLGVSTTMLSGATYAWFTMSKEVEVTGIHMTASTPASIQISLGQGTNKSTGGLTASIGSGTRLASVTAPDDDEYWSNTVDISEYYRFGRLSPATSTTGENIFYTFDITGVGKTLKGETIGDGGFMTSGTSTAAFSQADAGDPLDVANLTTDVALITDRTSNIEPLDAYAAGGAYYIDIPVWFRTSITGTDPQLAVKATFIAGENSYASGATDLLYKAARVSILQGNNDSTVKNTLTQAVICESGTNYYRTAEGAKNTGSITSAYTIANTTPSWAAVETVTQWTDANRNGDYAGDGDAVVKVAATTSGNAWGEATPYTIRIWLDGEDVNCWNATAGQDFGIQLTFLMKDPS